MKVSVSTAYSVFFWVKWITISVVLSPFTLGLSLLLLPFLFWYKQAVVNRSKFLFETGGKTITCEHGRWFVLDDDIVQVSAIDNIKLNRSGLGKLFGWCHMTIESRSASYALACVATAEAEAFRKEVM